MKLFGYNISKEIEKNREEEKPSSQTEVVVKSFAPKETEDGSRTISAGGYFGQYVDIDGTTVASDQDLILKYRNTAEYSECDTALNYIIEEAIVSSETAAPVSLRLDEIKLGDEIKDAIIDEFNHVVRLLDFNNKATDIFRNWYVDGRLYYHILIDEAKPDDGIVEVRYIDPIKMQKVREIETTVDPKTGVNLVKTTAEYYVYSENAITGSLVTTVSSGDSINGLKITDEAICYVPSGLLDSSRKRVISHLHKCLKPANQLRMMEDSLVIYRMSRAPERRIFYIDVGNLPKGKAEEYMQGIMSKYRNKLVYDSANGEVRDDRRHMSMLEDFWLPRREGGKGTEISTLPAGQNLGEIADIIYFKENLYRCLNVPLGRMKSETGFSFGRTSEISREEVSFQKFIDRVRKKFSQLFLHLLKTQLLLKNIITIEDWEVIREKIKIDFQKDNYFTELKEFEIMKERLGMLDTLKDKIGTYYSHKWVRANVLRQSDEEIERMDREIGEEAPANPKGEQSAESPEGMPSSDGPEKPAIDDIPEDEYIEPAVPSNPEPL